jgi:predicted ATP-grasp superfamily ATP-dependent carboligase
LLAAAGYDPLVVSDSPGIAGRSRWYRAAPKSKSTARPEADLPAWLSGLPVERAVLLPCSDDWMLNVAACADQVRDRFPTSVSSHAVLETLIDKWQLARVLADLRLPHPRTIPLDSTTDVADIPDSALEHGFIKPRDSASFFQHFGVKAFHVSSREDLAAKLADTAGRNLAVELQEYVPGPARNHFYVEGFIDRGGQVRAVFTRQRLRMSPPDFGNSTLFESVLPSVIPDAVETVTTLLTHLKFRGIFSVELKRDERDGICRLIEVNARPWWYVEFAGQCGVNVASMYVSDALGEPVASVDTFRVGMSCVYPYYDYFACRAMRKSGELSMTQWAKSWLTATQPVLRWNDPLPAMAAAGILSGHLGRMLGLAEKR